MLRGEVLTLLIESRVLRDNPLGDPYERDLPVYLPPEDRRDVSGGLPLVAVLAGYGGTGAGALVGTPWDPSFPERYEALLEKGEAQPAVFMFPDCFTRFGGSQYMNSSAQGRYEDHLVDELFPSVEQSLGEDGVVTGGRPERRGLMGKSSGGFAALHLAFARPGHFGALASHSGDAAFELGYRPDLPHLMGQLEQHGDVEAFVRAFEARPSKPQAMFMAMSMLAMAAAYSPDPDQPLGVALPFEPRTGRLREEVWARWLVHDPALLAAERGADLASAALVFVDAGLRDEYHLQYGARRVVEGLRSHGVAVHHEEFDDGHRGISYRYEASLPRLTRALST